MKAKKIMTNQKFIKENQKKKKIIFKCFNSIKSKVKDHKKQKENKFKKRKIQKDKVKFKKKIKCQSINNAKIKLNKKTMVLKVIENRQETQNKSVISWFLMSNQWS